MATTPNMTLGCGHRFCANCAKAGSLYSVSSGVLTSLGVGARPHATDAHTASLSSQLAALSGKLLQVEERLALQQHPAHLDQGPALQTLDARVTQEMSSLQQCVQNLEQKQARAAEDRRRLEKLIDDAARDSLGRGAALPAKEAPPSQAADPAEREDRGATAKRIDTLEKKMDKRLDYLASLVRDLSSQVQASVQLSQDNKAPELRSRLEALQGQIEASRDTATESLSELRDSVAERFSVVGRALKEEGRVSLRTEPLAAAACLLPDDTRVWVDLAAALYNSPQPSCTVGAQEYTSRDIVRRLSEVNARAESLYYHSLLLRGGQQEKVQGKKVGRSHLLFDALAAQDNTSVRGLAARDLMELGVADKGGVAGAKGAIYSKDDLTRMCRQPCTCPHHAPPGDDALESF